MQGKGQNKIGVVAISPFYSYKDIYKAGSKSVVRSSEVLAF